VVQILFLQKESKNSIRKKALIMSPKDVQTVEKKENKKKVTTEVLEDNRNDREFSLSLFIVYEYHPLSGWL